MTMRSKMRYGHAKAWPLDDLTSMLNGRKYTHKIYVYQQRIKKKSKTKQIKPSIQI